jgi:hypothetical protein
VVIVLQSTADKPYPSEQTTFKPAWWLGSLADGNVGMVVYPPATTILGRGATSQNPWALLSWFRMLNGAQTFLLENFTTSPTAPRVLIRALEVLGNGPRSKALLVEQSVGRGIVIATGLNLTRGLPCIAHDCAEPEKAWALDRLLRYGRSKLLQP